MKEAIDLCRQLIDHHRGDPPSPEFAEGDIIEDDRLPLRGTVRGFDEIVDPAGGSSLRLRENRRVSTT